MQRSGRALPPPGQPPRGGPTIATTLAVRSRTGAATVWVEVTYQGLAPPTDLFADLELIGWAPPTAGPPPREAIDWTTPDAATGERFTLRDWTIAGAVVNPPAGSGSRGGWTGTERAGHLASLGRVLRRHPTVAVDDPGGLLGLEPAAAAPSPSAPSAPPGASGAGRGDGTVAVLVTAPVEPSQAPAVEDGLAALGVTTVFDDHQRVQTARYRGSSYTTTVTERRVAAVVPVELAEAAAEVLRATGVGDISVVELDEDAVGADAPADAAAADGAARPSRTGRARVAMLASPHVRDAVDEVVGALGLVDVVVEPATRSELVSFRGSRTTRAVPALRVEVWIAPAHAEVVAARLAEAARVDRSDPARFRIELPEPPPAPPAPVAAATPVGAASPTALPLDPDPAVAPTVPAPPGPPGTVRFTDAARTGFVDPAMASRAMR